jgi:hypothetical protein
MSERLTVTSRRRPVEIARRIPVDIAAAAGILRQTPDRLIGPEFPASWIATGNRSLNVVLPGGFQLTREVRVGFGPIFEEEDGLAVTVWWEAKAHPHLFPTFDGALEVRRLDDETELRLVGSNEPPLGPIGRFADGVVGHRVVAASLEALLAGAADRLAAAASTR